MTNHDIARRLVRLADLVELEGVDPFRARTYRRAARVIASLGEDLASRPLAEHAFQDISGIGPAISKKIRELLETGRIAKLDELERRVPRGLIELADIVGVGPARARLIHAELGVLDLDGLARALEESRVRALPGFGARVERRIAEGLARRLAVSGSLHLSAARHALLPFVAGLRRERGVADAIAAGELRRAVDLVSSPVVLVACARRDAARVLDRVAADPLLTEVLDRGDDRLRARIAGDVALETRTVAPEAFAAATLFATGSDAHVARLVSLARERGLELREDGLFAGTRRAAAETEQDLYAALDLPFIEPELREDSGEIEAALDGTLPQLLRVEHMHGDLHSHTTASDGRASIEDMARAARDRGYEYLAITDHTKSTAIANGLDERRLLAHLAAIERVNERVPGIRLLKSAEVDILRDGSLDLPDDVLARLDVRVCSLHASLRLSSEEQTERVLRAMENRYFNVLGHPTGRILGRREPSPLDLERILAAARMHGCFVEVNAQPTRLDLASEYCRMAKDAGVKLVVSTDSHSAEGLAEMEVGVAHARRGWLEPDDVANTRSWEELRAMLVRD